MKSIHVPFGFYPDPIGGTEVYVAALAKMLVARGDMAIVAAPGPSDEDYEYEGVPVRRFAISEQIADISALYDEGDAEAAQRFSRVLDRDRPDVMHLHAFTRACSLRLVREAHARRIPVVFTYHTPTTSCMRGTLMLWGASPCDGTLEVRRCTACSLQGYGVPKLFARGLARLPAYRATGLGHGGKLGTLLGLSTLVDQRHHVIRSLFSEVDRIVAFRSWVEDLLLRNDVPASKIVRSRHALCHPIGTRSLRVRPGVPVRVAFIGRLDPTKGADVLIRAMRHIPGDVEIELTIFGITQSEAGERERRRLSDLAGHDRRVVFKPSVASSRVVETLSEHDILAVPSQWMETGPLVVLEAMAAGTPVIGSALGGILEMVDNGVTGVLVDDYRSPKAWATALLEICRRPDRIAAFASQIQAPDDMAAVATQMAQLYSELLAAPSGRSSHMFSVA